MFLDDKEEEDVGADWVDLVMGNGNRRVSLPNQKSPLGSSMVSTSTSLYHWTAMSQQRRRLKILTIYRGGLLLHDPSD